MLMETVERLGNSDLNEILFSEDARNLTLNFTFAGFVGGEGHDVVVRLNGITKVNINRANNDHGCYFVGDAKLERLVNEGETSEEPAYHFHLDGELTLDVSCTFVHIFEQAPVLLTSTREISAIK